MMILWLLLFLIVVVISFILAFLSMRDYQEIPASSKVEYALYLIRQPQNFDKNFLDSINLHLHKDNLIISIERLFKGNRAALTIFAPKKIMEKYTERFNLLELEDYAVNLSNQDVHVWEMGVKNARALDQVQIHGIFKNLPVLGQEDQFFWQVVLGPKGKENSGFHTQIRAAVYSKDPIRKKALEPLLQNIKAGDLIKVPRPIAGEQMMAFYKMRSLGKDNKGPVLSSERVLDLFKI